MTEYLIGIDAGCTSSKAVIFGTDGKIIASSATPSMRFKKRRADFEEFDVNELWNLVSRTINEAVKKAAIDPALIRGIGVTSFGNGVVFLDKDGNSIAPGCFSQDYRANEILEKYKKEGTYDKINNIIKGTLWSGQPAPILRWYKDNDRETYDKIGGFFTFKDYLMYRLTGVFATDLDCIGGSALLDMETMEYSRELMELFGIPELYDFLPKLAEPTEIIGCVTEEAAKLTGLKEGTPVVAGMMDILACLVGAGATGEGVYTAVAGTWCINETHSEKIIPGASANMPYLHKGEYLNCSYTGASGSNYEWFIHTLGDRAKDEADKRGVSIYDVLNELIAEVSPEDAKVIFSPFVAQPSIHPNAKANFIGIDQNTSYAEICHSVAEGVAYIHKYHVDFLKNSGLPLDTIRLTGGIARSKIWKQIFADVLQVPIVGVDCEETGALGSAIAAGIGAGVYGSYEEAFRKAVKTKAPVMPQIENYPCYERRYAEWTRVNNMMKGYWDYK